MSFAKLCGETTENAGTLLNLQDLLTVKNIFKLQILNFSHKWHKKQLPSIFEQHSDMLVTTQIQCKIYF